MKVNDLEINEITFGQERELYNLYKKSYRDSDLDFTTGEVTKLKIDWDAHDLAIVRVIDYAFNKPEEVLKEMKHPEIDTLGQKILLRYLRMDGDSGKE